jgi:hypothetical protein
MRLRTGRRAPLHAMPRSHFTPDQTNGDAGFGLAIVIFLASLSLFAVAIFL